MTEKVAVTSIDDLQPKMMLAGTVKNVTLFGAFIDMGIQHDGLVHISQLKAGKVNNVGDVVSTGQEVTVWVRSVDKQKGRIDLTMIEPAALAWGDLEVGKVVGGKVVRLKKFGAFVDIGAERAGLVHVSELSQEYVKAPSEVVSIGDDIEVKIIGVNRKEGKIDLSIKALHAEVLRVEYDDDDEDESEQMTAFAAAYQKAMGDEDEDAPVEVAVAEPESSSSVSDRERSEQDDLLSRTLEQHKTIE